MSIIPDITLEGIHELAEKNEVYLKVDKGRPWICTSFTALCDNETYWETTGARTTTARYLIHDAHDISIPIEGTKLYCCDFCYQIVMRKIWKLIAGGYKKGTFIKEGECQE